MVHVGAMFHVCAYIKDFARATFRVSAHTTDHARFRIHVSAHITDPERAMAHVSANITYPAWGHDPCKRIHHRRLRGHDPSKRIHCRHCKDQGPSKCIDQRPCKGHDPCKRIHHRPCRGHDPCQRRPCKGHGPCKRTRPTLAQGWWPRSCEPVAAKTVPTAEIQWCQELPNSPSPTLSPTLLASLPVYSKRFLFVAIRKTEVKEVVSKMHAIWTMFACSAKKNILSGCVPCKAWNGRQQCSICKASDTTDLDWLHKHCPLGGPREKNHVSFCASLLQAAKTVPILGCGHWHCRWRLGHLHGYCFL